MRVELPNSPRDVLEISSAWLRFIVNLVVRAAELGGFWRYPLSGSAATSEEMNARDTLYWIYKSKNPILRYEKGIPSSNLPGSYLGKPKLPAGFEMQTSVSFAAVGDILRSKGIEQSKNLLYEHINDLVFGQDVSYANFESPVTEQDLVDEVIGDKAPPVECCSKPQFDILKGHKGRVFDVLHTANNHMYDMGTEGVETTLNVLQSEGILDVGTNRTPDTYGRAKTLSKNGIKIGFASDCFGLNGRTLPVEERYRIHVSKLLSKRSAPDLTLLRRQIEDCKAQRCDFVVASVHWGHEFEFFPRFVQVEAARSLAELGADCVICHHPHVIQPVETYQTIRDPNRTAVIAYSLGSLTWGFSAPHIALSAILNLGLVKGRLDGEKRTFINDVRVTPVFRTLTQNDGIDVTRIERLSDHLAPNASPYSQEYVARIKNYADLVLGDDWPSKQWVLPSEP
ncbi:CapA family protein [Primorskyibacter sp. S87]|uniref:CapA family protein n=1 Tax=Primorskyibacter sp. S87 TaxID=3415126 RepID=UPI003C7C29A2